VDADFVDKFVLFTISMKLIRAKQRSALKPNFQHRGHFGLACAISVGNVLRPVPKVLFMKKVVSIMLMKKSALVVGNVLMPVLLA